MRRKSMRVLCANNLCKDKADKFTWGLCPSCWAAAKVGAEVWSAIMMVAIGIYQLAVYLLSKG